MTVQPPPEPRSPILAVVTEHFLLFSALAIIGAVVFGTLFLGGYLGVFDWRLIWIIDYPDILKAGLVGTAAAASLVGIIGPVLESAYRMATERGASAWLAAVPFAVVGLGVFAIYLWQESHSPEPRYALGFFGVMCAMLLFVIASIVFAAVTTQQRIALPVAIQFVALCGLATLISGGFFGLLVRDRDGFKDYEVVLRSKTLAGVGLVMMTSQYAVLLKGDSTAIIPLTEVLRIEHRKRSGFQ